MSQYSSTSHQRFEMNPQRQVNNLESRIAINVHSPEKLVCIRILSSFTKNVMPLSGLVDTGELNQLVIRRRDILLTTLIRKEQEDLSIMTLIFLIPRSLREQNTVCTWICRCLLLTVVSQTLRSKTQSAAYIVSIASSIQNTFSTQIQKQAGQNRKPYQRRARCKGVSFEQTTES